ncbi:unnamed protein product [Ilex paraguariensis]|uniref:Uncharacterized protein n=1 Tax=Ilex paraguariensis TaxID=185542 RepID=A0ABC8T7U0_9AQUA
MLVEDRVELQAQCSAIPYSRQKTAIPSRRNKLVKNFLSFLYASESCEATPSTLYIPDETSSLSIPSIDLTLLLDHAPTFADLSNDFKTSVPSTDLPADFKTSILPPEPPIDKVPVASPIISSPPWPADVEPEEHLTKKRRMKSPPTSEWLKFIFRPVLKVLSIFVEDWL